MDNRYEALQDYYKNKGYEGEAAARKINQTCQQLASIRTNPGVKESDQGTKARLEGPNKMGR